MNLNEALEVYLDNILKANETTNVTSITDRDKALLLHLEDSLSSLPFIEDTPDGPYADLGTGGGFPGVPLALATQRETVLIDSVRKKLNIIQSAVEHIDYPHNIACYHGRIEDFAKERPEQFALLTARALSSLPSLVELASPLLMKEGILVCYKAQISDDELKNGDNAAKQVGMKRVSINTFTLRDRETSRSLVIYKKVGNSHIKLPRKVGMAQKQPLS